ncbi:MAG TPA: TlpA disulfide reductase family protein [Castellaniella sp.]|uniref:TlpA family protein disulfide reductase n=1 Tax=Castellaniella sp. TaxID=1955812 RepID=UPI002EFFBB5E
MDRRDFLRCGSLAALMLAGSAAQAFSLPPDPVFGRSFEDLQGRQMSMAGYVGRPVVLNFWASWCAPCVREMPMLEALHHSHPQLVIVGVAIDTRSNVQRFLQKVTVSYPLVLGGTDGISLMRTLGNKGGGLPFTVFFNSGGRASSMVLGELTPATLDARLSKIL